MMCYQAWHDMANVFERADHWRVPVLARRLGAWKKYVGFAFLSKKQKGQNYSVSVLQPFPSP
jgi:hypothetical protein